MHYTLWLEVDREKSALCIRYLDSFANEPRHRLQLPLGDVVLERFQEDSKIWIWRLYSGEQI